jgi:hypothetical protein
MIVMSAIIAVGCWLIFSILVVCGLAGLGRDR